MTASARWSDSSIWLIAKSRSASCRFRLNISRGRASTGEVLTLLGGDTTAA